MRDRVRVLQLVALVLLLAASAAATTSSAATGSTTIGATVLSATSLNTTACGPGLSLGSMVVGSTSIGGNCDVTFGSSNDTAGLRLFQTDGAGSALTQFPAIAPVKKSGAFDYNGLSAKDDNEAWAVGEVRKTGDPTPITHTTDAGATWTMQTSCKPNVVLNDVDYVSGSTVVAIGSSSTICRSTDAGATWTTITSPTAATWYGLDIRPDGIGWVVGNAGRIATTTDGGATWTNITVSDPTMTFNEVVAPTTTRLYAVGTTTGLPRTSAVLTSSDGGVTWSSYTLGSTVPTGWAYGLVATSATSAIAGSAYGKFLTTDSGATWTKVDTTAGICLTAWGSRVYSFYGSNTATRMSTDGGATWSTTASLVPSTGQLYGCDATSASIAWVAGNNDQRARTADAGASYTLAPTTFRDLRGVVAWTRDAWTAVGDFGAIRTSTDGGTTVTSPASPTAQTLLDATMVNSTSAVAVGKAGTVIRTTDRGATWSSVSSGTAIGLLDVDEVPGSPVYAVGNGVMIRSTDDGATWATVATAPAVTMTSVAVAPGGILWVGTSAGAIYRSTDAGATWSLQTTGTTLQIATIDTLDGTSAVAYSVQDPNDDAQRLTTTNGGTTWTATTVSNVTFFAVRYLDATTLVAGTNLGYRRSTDGGTTWIAQSGFTNVYGVAPLDVNSFVLAGQGDVIATVLPTQTFSDYGAGVDFLGATSVFGACLETATGTSTTAWPVAGTGNCTAANTTVWRGIAADTAGTTAKVASTATTGTGSLRLRFAAKPGSGQLSGTYAAQLGWEVVAPDA